MNKILALMIGLTSIVAAQSAVAETLKVAVAQRGFWNSTFIEVGLKQGFFKEAGLDIEILYTEGGASTLTPVIAGSIDIAMTNGILGVVAAYAKGMPVRIISAEATGAAEAFWYARPESGIKRLADTNGKTVEFSSPGSSTNLILLQLVNQAKVTPKLVATGGAPGHPHAGDVGTDRRRLVGASFRAAALGRRPARHHRARERRGRARRADHPSQCRQRQCARAEARCFRPASSKS